MRMWLFRIFAVLGLLAFAAVIWFAGPLIGYGGARPLEDAFVRAMTICIAIAILTGWYGFVWIGKYRAEKALEGALRASGESDSEASILAEKMAAALKILKRSSGKRSFLYDLPWYIIIGPPGSGKTTALINSGLKFPLQQDGVPASIAGVGGTRYCDWWFTDEAVLIDTAGRYTTQDSDAEADGKNWIAFLDLLKRNRPKQPVNGIIITISLEDLMTLGEQEIRAHALAVRNRLLEVHRELKVDFPIYALFTKADLISGFTEYFGNFPESRRRKVWGHTFQTEDHKRNTIAEVPGEFDALVARLTEEMPDRLEEEPDPVARIGLFSFPAQFADLRDMISGYLNTIFAKTDFDSDARLRGFYFSSGTQEGTPFDQLLGVMAKNFRGQSVEAAYSGSGKSYFLHDVLRKVIFGESGWVARKMGAVRRARFFRVASCTTIGLISILVGGAWLWSYAGNKALIDETERTVIEYRVLARPVLDKGVVSEADFHVVLAFLRKLRTMPTGYDNRNLEVPRNEGFGLSQRQRLVSAAVTSYRDALESVLRSRLILRLEQQIESNIDDPLFIYRAIKVYLMLGGRAPKVDKDLIFNWMRRDWEENLYRGAANAEGRQDLELHLRAMLDLDIGRKPTFELNGPLVKTAQRTLARLKPADRAYSLIKSRAMHAAIEDWAVAQAGGADSVRVFETVDGTDIRDLHVPGFYTSRGFQNHFLGQIGQVADILADERWVMGESGKPDTADNLIDRLAADLLDRYRRDFVAEWEKALSNIRLRSMTADKPRYSVLNEIVSETSPARRLFDSIARETRLAELPDGAGIAADFKPYHLLVDGEPGQRPIDNLIRNFEEIYNGLVLVAGHPSQAAEAAAKLQRDLSALRANASGLPKPLARMVRVSAEELGSDAADRTLARLSRLLNRTVTQACRRAVSKRYPFADSPKDVPIADFARMFAPNGVIDRFFARNLAQLADMSGTTWQWKTDTNIGRRLSGQSLLEFQRAAQIRDAFFPKGDAKPVVKISVLAEPLSNDVDAAFFEVNGTVLQTVHSQPRDFLWPGDGDAGIAGITIAPEIAGQPSQLTRTGPWAFKRLLEAASVSGRGDDLLVRFVMGSRALSYRIRFDTNPNPFTLEALKRFKCPAAL